MNFTTFDFTTFERHVFREELPKDYRKIWKRMLSWDFDFQIESSCNFGHQTLSIWCYLCFYFISFTNEETLFLF